MVFDSNKMQSIYSALDLHDHKRKDLQLGFLFRIFNRWLCGPNATKLIADKLDFELNVSTFFASIQRRMFFREHSHFLRVVRRTFLNPWQYSLKQEGLVVAPTKETKVFESRILKREEITGGQRKLHNSKLHNLQSLPNIDTMIKSNKIKLAKF
jgi:hypothetical protein